MAGIALRCYMDMLVYEFLRAKKCIGEINKEDAVEAAIHKR